VNSLLVLIELFSLGVTAETLRANIGSKSAISLQRGPIDPKFHVEDDALTNYSSSQKTRLNALPSGIKLCTYLSSVLSQITSRLTDGQTDRILTARPRLHSMQHGIGATTVGTGGDWSPTFILGDQQLLGRNFQKQELVTRMHHLTSEFSKIFRGG